MAPKNILLAGPPRCGKSTVIEKLVRQVKSPMTGFFTREIRERGKRETLPRTLDSSNPVVATIAFKGTQYIKKIKERKDILLVMVSEKNRDPWFLS